MFFDLYSPFKLLLLTQRAFEKPVNAKCGFFFNTIKTSIILLPVKAVVTLRSDVLYREISHPKFNLKDKIPPPPS